jgi:hypothetical protein
MDITTVKSAIMLNGYSNAELNELAEAIRYARNQLGQEIKRSIRVGDNVNFVDNRSGTNYTGAVTKIAMEDGRTCEVYGDTDRGFEIGHNGRRLKNRFKTLEQATLAIEIYQRRCAGQAQNRDYLDEA